MKPKWGSEGLGTTDQLIDRFDAEGRLVREVADLKPTDVSDLAYKTLRGGGTSAGGVLSGEVVRLIDRWATGLPPEVMLFTHRRVATAGTNIFNLTSGSTFELPLLNLQQGESFILLRAVQTWLQQGRDPADPDALTALNDYHAAYGKISFEVLFNGGLPVDARETAVYFDNDAGVPAYVTLQVPGFTILNRNILELGAQPIAWYAKDSTRISARWQNRTNPTEIDYTPTVVLVEIQGYTMATKVLDNILLRIRRG